MLFKVSRRPYTGGQEYLIHKHEDGSEFYRGPSAPEVIAEALKDKDTTYFEWGYDTSTNSTDMIGDEVPAPAPSGG